MVEEQYFQQMVLEQLKIHLEKNMILDSYFIPHISIKWIINLNVEPRTIKLLEENTRKNMTLG